MERILPSENGDKSVMDNGMTRYGSLLSRLRRDTRCGVILRVQSGGERYFLLFFVVDTCTDRIRETVCNGSELDKIPLTVICC